MEIYYQGEKPLANERCTSLFAKKRTSLFANYRTSLIAKKCTLLIAIYNPLVFIRVILIFRDTINKTYEPHTLFRINGLTNRRKHQRMKKPNDAYQVSICQKAT